MKTYCLVGAGNRGSYMYALPILQKYRNIATLKGVFDTNHRRSELLKARSGMDVPIYTEFEPMLQQARPDVVIVTSMDSTHHQYIIKALEFGCDVISEKPLTTDEKKCNEILNAEKRTGRKVRITFNLRFMPLIETLKRLVMEGAIGPIYLVHFEWFLDTRHGADYFRRWHRRKENSGGLLVHKASHHFDIINWLLEDEPAEVHAFGNTRFYGPTRSQSSSRCMGCVYKDSCEFYFDIGQGPVKALYQDCEDADGYIRDQCVFSENINIEDTMSVTVKYTSGALMSYSLCAYSPYEGFRIVLNGAGGRLEVDCMDGAVGPFAGKKIQRINLFNRKSEKIEIPLSKEELAGHGGADERLLQALLTGKDNDSLKQLAGSWDGAMSCAIGFAANRSMREGTAIRIVDQIQRPGEEL